MSKTVNNRSIVCALFLIFSLFTMSFEIQIKGNKKLGESCKYKRRGSECDRKQKLVCGMNENYDVDNLVCVKKFKTSGYCYSGYECAENFSCNDVKEELEDESTRQVKVCMKSTGLFSYIKKATKAVVSGVGTGLSVVGHAAAAALQPTNCIYGNCHGLKN